MEEQQEKKSIITDLSSVKAKRIITDLSNMVVMIDGECKHFKEAVALAFDLDPQLVRDFTNYDLVRTAKGVSSHNQGMNYAQWLLKSDNKSQWISELFSFLFDYGDSEHREPWEHSEATKNRLRAFVLHLDQNYEGNVVKYLQSCSKRLWLNDDAYFTTTYRWHVNLAEKMLISYKEGGDYLYSHYDYENGIVHYGK